jgi:hypothetical protein
MVLEPTFSFTLPSLHDDLPIDCRIYHPTNLGKQLESTPTNSSGLRGAVIAHPYAPLGGTFDDAVVLALTECLVGEGMVVGTFNFRYAMSLLHMDVVLGWSPMLTTK